MRLWQKSIVVVFSLLLVVLMIHDQPAIPHALAQSQEAEMTRCLADWGGTHPNATARVQFQGDIFCEGQVAHYAIPAAYESCALREYDRIIAANTGTLSDANRVEIKRVCSPNLQSPPPGSNPLPPRPTLRSSTNTTSDNGPLRPLIFTKTPNSVFLGTLTGPTTANLREEYADPLLLVSDRQTGFQILVRFFLGFIGIITLLYLVFHSFRYAMSRGEEAQITQAKKGIMYAIIGLIVILAAYTIVATVLNFGAQPTPSAGIGIGVSF